MVNIVVEAIRESASSFGRNAVFSHRDIIRFLVLESFQ